MNVNNQNNYETYSSDLKRKYDEEDLNEYESYQKYQKNTSLEASEEVNMTLSNNSQIEQRDIIERCIVLFNEFDQEELELLKNLFKNALTQQDAYKLMQSKNYPLTQQLFVVYQSQSQKIQSVIYSTIVTRIFERAQKNYGPLPSGLGHWSY